MKPPVRLLVAFAGAACFAGCASPPLRPFLRSTSVDAQVHCFQGGTERQLLTACAAVLQDLGFTLVGGDGALGLIVATKERSARGTPTAADAARDVVGVAAVVAGSVALAGPLAPFLLMQGANGENDPPDRQVLRVSLAVEPRAAPGGNVVRLVAQRIVYSRLNRVLLAETLEDSTLAPTFFDALAKSVFLQAHHL